MPNDVSDQSFTDIGKRLALLLASSSLSEEEKNAWVTLIPEMTLEQLDRLGRALEQNISGASALELKKLTDAMQQINERHAKAQEEAVAKAQESLEEIESLLRSQD